MYIVSAGNSTVPTGTSSAINIIEQVVQRRSRLEQDAFARVEHLPAQGAVSPSAVIGIASIRLGRCQREAGEHHNPHRQFR